MIVPHDSQPISEKTMSSSNAPTILIPPHAKLVQDFNLRIPDRDRSDANNPPPGGPDHIVFTASGRRCDFVSAYPELGVACDRLGFGNGLTLGQWCQAPGWALMDLARAADPPPPAPLAYCTMATLTELIEDIIVAHHRPLLNEARRIGILVDQFWWRHPELHPLAICSDFVVFAQSLTALLHQGESEVFPLALEVERASRLRTEGNGLGNLTNSIHSMRLGSSKADADLDCLLSLVTPVSSTDDPDLALITHGMRAMQANLAAHDAKVSTVLAPAANIAEELAWSQRYTQWGTPIHMSCGELLE